MPYESLIYALLSKEQTKLCCNSLRRALMQDWISGEEGWSFLIPSPLYLRALPVREAAMQSCPPWGCCL